MVKKARNLTKPLETFAIVSDGKYTIVECNKIELGDLLELYTEYDDDSKNLIAAFLKWERIILLTEESLALLEKLPSEPILRKASEK